MKNLDKIQGCLLGGAAGDALGYEVEFWDEYQILSHFGKPGITEYALHDGLAEISDDTQMTLFTANGLLASDARAKRLPGTGSPFANISMAYREWYRTQVSSWEETRGTHYHCWLMEEPRMFASRAPGVTCMNAIRTRGAQGTMENPINDSKGCGGVMRVAPIGLYYDESADTAMVDLLGAGAAAMTHGNQMGYIPAALLVHIVRFLALGDKPHVKDALLDGMEALGALFPDSADMADFETLLQKAVILAEHCESDLTAIHALGEGWCGDEALAIALYCAMKYEDDFEKCLIAAVNHNGDSDSTGAIAGNILGARLGLSGIPAKFRENLELSDVILTLANDLYTGCPLETGGELNTPEQKRWYWMYLRGRKDDATTWN